MSDNRGIPEELSQLETDLGDVERRVRLRIDPGPTAMLIAGAVLALVIAASLPWADGYSGWQVFAGQGDVGVLVRLFAWTAIGFGVLGSAIALVTRLWALAWVCALGCGFSIVDGVWAIWARQTGEIPGPGIGLVLAVLAIVVLTWCWVRLSWSRG